MTSIQHNFESSRFDVYGDGQRIGFLQYEMRRGRMCFLRTELIPGLQRRKRLDFILGEILDDLHQRRIEVVPYCPVVRSFLAKRPEYHRLMSKDQLRQFGLVTQEPTLAKTAVG